ncbi:MAG: cytidylyltransferase [Methylocystis sp.]|nr:cytidylyltransferase [Methylocystis sp.]
MIVAILIGREGSTGFPGKNVIPVAGRPLAAWPLLTARETAKIGRTYVSTDSPRLKDIAREHGAHVIDRPMQLCSKAALGEHAYQHAHGVIRAHLLSEGLGEPELYVLLMANSPTVSSAMLTEGIEILQSRPEMDSAVTVSCYNMWSPLRARKIGDDGLLHPFVSFEAFGDPNTLNCDRDSQGDVWFADMGASIIRPRNLDDLDSGMPPQKWMGQKIYPIKNVAGLDVDFAWQAPQAEYWLQMQRKSPG